MPRVQGCLICLLTSLQQPAAMLHQARHDVSVVVADGAQVDASCLDAGVAHPQPLAQRGEPEPERLIQVPVVGPARPCPSSIFCDKNRRDIGKSQSIWADSKMETAGSRLSPRAGLDAQKLLSLRGRQVPEAVAGAGCVPWSRASPAYIPITDPHEHQHQRRRPRTRHHTPTPRMPARAMTVAQATAAAEEARRHQYERMT
jgi:hypothetical protein